MPNPAFETCVPRPGAKLSVTKGLLQLAATFVWWAGSLFLGAGRFDWVRGWISAGIWITGLTTIGIVGYRYNPAVMDARAPRRFKDAKHFDKIFWAAYFPLVFIQPAVAGMDAVRFRWSSMPFGFVYVGALTFGLSAVLIGWVLCVNPFAEATVRIQTDRAHIVVTSGPYSLVRHPMYVGAILMLLGVPLLWGSVWALILGAVIVLLLIWRTSREDQTLQQELAGYQEYASTTRYRLLPGLW